MIRFPRLAQRFLNAPLALLPSQAALVLEMLRSDAPSALLAPAERDDRDRIYDVVGGIAVVPIRGILTHGSDFWFWCGCSYDRIREAVATAIGDPDVRALVLHIDSPGGEVAGCADLGDAIYAMRGEKPIWAILDESAYSAAYWLASAADRIVVPRTGGTGSIGVVTQHVSLVGALEQAGIEITTIQFGDQKTETYPTTKMTDPAKARVQADVDVLGGMFVDTVARNRGIAASKVRATQAGTFLGKAGLDVGLADAVMSPDEAFLALMDQLSSASSSSRRQARAIVAAHRKAV